MMGLWNYWPSEQVFPAGRREGNPLLKADFGPAVVRQTMPNGRVRTRIRCSIIQLSRIEKPPNKPADQPSISYARATFFGFLN